MFVKNDNFYVNNKVSVIRVSSTILNIKYSLDAHLLK